MNGVNSNAKGKRIEREAAAFLNRLGFPGRRGQQRAGGPDSPDVVVPGLPRIHIEVKGDKAIGIGTVALSNAIAQAQRDASEGIVPVVLWKPHRRPWRLTWAEHGVEATTTGDNAIRITLNRLNCDRPHTKEKA